jgi:cysteine-rich CPXCG protein
MRFAHDPPPEPGEDPLDEEFALGDGTADLEALVTCPYCAEQVSLTLDPGSGAQQDYVEDCPVCCQSWEVSVRYDREGRAEVSLEES